MKLKRTVRITVWAIGAVVVLSAYAVAIWAAPTLLGVPDLATPPGPDATLTARHNARLLMISLGGALVVGIGLLYTARNYRLSHRGQVTDRFTKALERLGSPELYVRIGGIHALQHVLLDSPDHHADIVEVLVAFIRQRAPRVQDGKTSPIYPRPRPPKEPDADVQAALTALGRRPHRPDRERGPLDFHSLHFEGADLSDGRFSAANLGGAQLEGARLGHAHLQGAYLAGAQLHGAGLWQAHLQNANLRWAQLKGAELLGAQLRGADLIGAQLQGATLVMADLQNAQLSHADLQEANLVGAQLQGACLRETRLQNAVLSKAQFCDKKGLRATQHIQPDQLAEACNVDEARLPERLRDEVEELRARHISAQEAPAERQYLPGPQRPI